MTFVDQETYTRLSNLYDVLASTTLDPSRRDPDDADVAVLREHVEKLTARVWAKVSGRPSLCGEKSPMQLMHLLDCLHLVGCFSAEADNAGGVLSSLGSNAAAHKRLHSYVALAKKLSDMPVGVDMEKTARFKALLSNFSRTIERYERQTFQLQQEFQELLRATSDLAAKAECGRARLFPDRVEHVETRLRFYGRNTPLSFPTAMPDDACTGCNKHDSDTDTDVDAGLVRFCEVQNEGVCGHVWHASCVKRALLRAYRDRRKAAMCPRCAFEFDERNLIMFNARRPTPAPTTTICLRLPCADRRSEEELCDAAPVGHQREGQPLDVSEEVCEKSSPSSATSSTHETVAESDAVQALASMHGSEEKCSVDEERSDAKAPADENQRPASEERVNGKKRIGSPEAHARKITPTIIDLADDSSSCEEDKEHRSKRRKTIFVGVRERDDDFIERCSTSSDESLEEGARASRPPRRRPRPRISLKRNPKRSARRAPRMDHSFFWHFDD